MRQAYKEFRQCKQYSAQHVVQASIPRRRDLTAARSRNVLKEATTVLGSNEVNRNVAVEERLMKIWGCKLSWHRKFARICCKFASSCQQLLTGAQTSLDALPESPFLQQHCDSVLQATESMHKSSMTFLHRIMNCLWDQHPDIAHIQQVKVVWYCRTYMMSKACLYTLQSGSAVILFAAEAMPVSAVAYVMADIAPIDIDMGPACVT